MYDIYIKPDGVCQSPRFKEIDAFFHIHDDDDDDVSFKQVQINDWQIINKAALSISVILIVGEQVIHCIT